MIAVTRLNGSRFAVNPDLIERVQQNPDTTLVMVGGATYVVRESLPEIVTLITEFRALVLATAHTHATSTGPHLHVAHTPTGDDELVAEVPGGGTVSAPTPIRPTER